MKKIDKEILATIADLHELPKDGVYNIRVNGESVARQVSEDINIVTKTDKPGIDIFVKAGIKGKSVHIPVVLSNAGHNECVCNDFYIGKDSDVLIVAGCGIHNDGDCTSQHDGVHTFYLSENSKVRYLEKHYGEGSGTGERILNPETVVYLDDGATMEMETSQIRGVDSTVRTTSAEMKANAKFIVKERLVTHGEQNAKTVFVLNINGSGSTAHIASRSVAEGNSSQAFHADIYGNSACYARSECDAILRDNGKVKAVPMVAANHGDAMLVHEASIGKVAGEQLTKLMSLGLSEKQAEDKIIEGFLK